MPTICEAEKSGRVRYYINEEKRVVVAVLSTDIFEFVKEISAIIPPYFKEDGTFKKLLLSPTYKGKAKCHEDDEWNVEIGKEYARERAFYKYHLTRLQLMDVFQENLEKFDNKIAKTMENAYLALSKRAKYTVK